MADNTEDKKEEEKKVDHNAEMLAKLGEIDARIGELERKHTESSQPTTPIPSVEPTKPDGGNGGTSTDTGGSDTSTKKEESTKTEPEVPPQPIHRWFRKIGD